MFGVVRLWCACNVLLLTGGVNYKIVQKNIVRACTCHLDSNIVDVAIVAAVCFSIAYWKKIGDCEKKRKTYLLWNS